MKYVGNLTEVYSGTVNTHFPIFQYSIKSNTITNYYGRENNARSWILFSDISKGFSVLPDFTSLV